MKKEHMYSNIIMHMPKNMILQAYKLFFGTLTSKYRLQIINLLRESPKTVTKIQEKLNIEQTLLSHNLKRLRHCGFVEVEQKGKYRTYRLNKKTIMPLMKIIDKHMEKFCIKIIGGRKH